MNPDGWGPWAGRIITGDEFQRLIYTVNTNGVVTPYDTTTLGLSGMRVEDFEIIPPDQDLYGCDLFGNALVKLSREHLRGVVGDLLITEAGEYGSSAEKIGKVFVLRWDNASGRFQVVHVPYLRRDGSNGLFEHVSFAPIDLPPLTP
jgi:hypothetical protein